MIKLVKWPKNKIRLTETQGKSDDRQNRQADTENFLDLAKNADND